MSGSTNPKPLHCSNVPTIFIFPLFNIFTISPSALLPYSSFLFTRYNTLSLCIAPLIWFAGINISSPCSLSTNPKPLECARNVPCSIFNAFGDISFPFFVSTAFPSSKSSFTICSKYCLSSFGTLSIVQISFLFMGIYSLLSKYCCIFSFLRSIISFLSISSYSIIFSFLY